MTLAAGEFIRRFLLHVLPRGFHRIRHYGLFASAPARPRWRGPGRCWPCRCRSHHHRPRRTSLPPRRSHAHHAPAAAAAWSSSPSSPARCSPAHRRPRPPLPGSARRDPARPDLLPRRSCAVAAAGHPCVPPSLAPCRGPADAPIGRASTREQLPRKGGGACPTTAEPRAEQRGSTQIPIAAARKPAGSCVGGIRTPALSRPQRRRRPASGNLHHHGRSRHLRHSSEADMP